MSKTVTRLSTKISMQVRELEVEIVSLRAEVGRQKHINAVLLEEHQRMTLALKKETEEADYTCAFVGGTCTKRATCEASFLDRSAKWHLCCDEHASTAMRGRVKFRNIPEQGPLTKGAYVLATKYEDADPMDHWAIGYFDSMLPKIGSDRYMVVDARGNQFRGNGFRQAIRITFQQGEYLRNNTTMIEKSGRPVTDFLKEQD